MDNNNKDIITQATKAEARLFRRLGQSAFYRTPLRAILALLWAFLWLIVGGVSFIALIALLIKGISSNEELTAIIVPGVFLGFFAFLCLGLSLKLLTRWIAIIKNKDEKFKLKAIPWLLLLIGLTILIFALTFYSLMKGRHVF